MQKAYARINWQNSPSTATPLGESKLLPMDASIDEIDNRVVTFDTTKANQSDLLGCLSNVTYNSSTGVFVFTWKNGNTLTADLNIEKIPVNFSMSAQGVITMTTSDGSTYTADVGELIKTYTFQDSSEIDFTTTTDADGNKTITASLVDGSISGSKLYPNYLADCQAAVSNSSANATLAQSWAVGGTNTRTGEDTNNAEYWCEMARQASGDGHTIIDPAGTAMENRSGLQFTGNVTVTDDSTNDRTVVNVTGVADNPTFTEAETRANIVSGESFATILGKIKKFFTDLKTIAFTGSYSDLSGTENVAVKNANNQFSTAQTIDLKNGTTTTVGNSAIVLGNDTAQGNEGNSQGRVRLFGSGSNYTDIVALNSTANRQITLPDANGTVALTSDIPDMTNVAYKNVNNYFSTAQTLNQKNGTTTSVGTSYLILGNATAEGTANNSKGIVRIYGKNTKYADIMATNVTGNRTFELPNASGTLALTDLVAYQDFQVALAVNCEQTVGINTVKSGYTLVGATFIQNEDLYWLTVTDNLHPQLSIITAENKVQLFLMKKSGNLSATRTIKFRCIYIKN